MGGERGRGEETSENKTINHAFILFLPFAEDNNKRRMKQYS